MYVVFSRHCSTIWMADHGSVCFACVLLSVCAGFSSGVMGLMMLIGNLSGAALGVVAEVSDSPIWNARFG